MRNVILIMTLGLALALALQPAAAQSVPLTNIEIRMVKTSTKPPLRVTADTRNPNDFAVRDVEVDCTIKDQAGKDLAAYSSTILGQLSANQRTTTRNLNIGAWPEQGYAALCVSKRAVRVTPAAAPPTASAPPTAPASAPPSAPSAQNPQPPAAERP